jgi:hypothetical protein
LDQLPVDPWIPEALDEAEKGTLRSHGVVLMM